LQGVTMLQVDAIPICGLLKSSSLKPTGRSIARLAERSTPSTTGAECSRMGSTGVVGFLDIWLRSEEIKSVVGGGLYQRIFRSPAAQAVAGNFLSGATCFYHALRNMAPKNALPGELASQL
jgi:hypothetical protein